MEFLRRVKIVMKKDDLDLKTDVFEEFILKWIF
jgi:hypothetical protein